MLLRRCRRCICAFTYVVIFNGRTAVNGYSNQQRAWQGSGAKMEAVPRVARLSTRRSKLMGSAYGEGVYVFANSAGSIPFDCPNVYPIRAGGFVRRPDVHREAS